MSEHRFKAAAAGGSQCGCDAGGVADLPALALRQAAGGNARREFLMAELAL